MVFRNMSSSETTGNFPAALTQYFTGNTGLRHGLIVSAFPLPSHSDSGEECFSRLDYGSLALRPAALLALLSEQTRLTSSLRGRLHPGASNGLVTRAVAEYTYSANWVICTESG